MPRFPDRLPRVPDHPVSWGIAQALAVLLGAQVLSAFWFVAVASVTGADAADLSLVTLAVVQLALVVAYLGGPILVTRTLGEGPVADLGLRLRGVDLVVGVIVGVVSQLLLINGLYLLIGRFVDVDAGEAARDLADRAGGTAGTVALVWVTLVVAPLIEEVFFRGLLLRSLGLRLPNWVALVVSAGLFALVHFQAVQFAGLFVVGLVTGAAALFTGRLGAAWAVHLGFNLTAVVQLLAF